MTKKKKIKYDKSLAEGYKNVAGFEKSFLATASRLQDYLSRYTRANDLSNDYNRGGTSINTAPVMRNSDEIEREDRSFAENLIQSGRLWIKKQIDLWIDTDNHNIDSAQQENEDLDKIKRYNDILNQLDELKLQYEGIYQMASKTLDPYFYIKTRQLESKMSELENERSELDNYFLGEGKTHTPIAQLMFDAGKMDNVDKGYMERMSLLDGLQDNTIKTNHTLLRPVTNLVNVPIALSDAILNSILFVSNVANSFGSYVLQQISGQGNDGEINTYRTSELIKTLPIDDPLVLKTYRGNSILNRNNTKSTIDIDKVNQWKLYNQDLINQNKVALQNDIYTKNTGNANLALFIIDTPIVGSALEATGLDEALRNSPLAEKEINLYHPEKLDPKFEQEHELFGKHWYDSVIHPLDAFIETASSIGMMKHTINSMGIDGLLRFVSKKVPVVAAAVSTAQWLDTIVKQRKEETGLEEIQGLSERVASEGLTQSNFNYVTDKIREELDKVGIDHRNLKVDDLVKFAIAYNFDTGDNTFEEAKRNARRGIQTLVNQNNSLAVVDYLEALPFMMYGGRVINDFAKGALTKRFLSQYGDVAMPILERNQPRLKGIVNTVADKAAKRFLSKDLDNYEKAVSEIAKGLKIGHITQSVGDFGKIWLRQAALEGIEEGQQEILQNRYKRGIYDDNVQPYKMLSLGDMYANLGLAGESIASYVINMFNGTAPWDPELSVDNVYRAMNIGFASALVQNLGQHTFKSAIDLATRNKESGIGGLLQQLKTDGHVARIIGQAFNDVDDFHKLEMFYDAFHKTGADDLKLRKSLNKIRESIKEGLLLNKQYVNDDIRLMENAWALYNNERINDLIDEYNETAKDGKKLIKGSDRHKYFVILGAKYITDYLMTNDLSEKQYDEISKDQVEALDIVSKLFDPSISEEEKTAIADKYPVFMKTILNMSEDYEDFFKSRKRQMNSKYANWTKKYSKLEQWLKDPDIRSEILKRGIEEDILLKLESGEIEDAVKVQIERSFNDKNDKTSILHKIYEDQNRREFLKQFEDEKTGAERFIGNRFVRKVLRGKGIKKHASDEVISGIAEHIYWDSKDKYKQRNDILNEAFELKKQGIISLEDYINERVRILSFLRQKQGIQQAISLANNRENLLSTMLKITGLDVNTDRIGGFIDLLKKLLDAMNKREAKILKIHGSSIPSFDSMFDRNKTYGFDNDEEMNTKRMYLALNIAARDAQLTLADAFTLGKKTPSDLRKVIFGSSTSDTILDESVENYNKAVSLLSVNQEDMDKEHVEAVDALMSANKAIKDAFFKVINKEIDDAEHRLRIARRRWVDEDPVTLQDVEEALEGDEEAVEKVSREEGEEDSKEKVSAPKERQKTRAEKELENKFIGTEKEEKNARAERMKKKRQQAEQEEDDEVDEYEFDDIDDDFEENFEEPGENESETKPSKEDSKSIQDQRQEDDTDPYSSIREISNEYDWAPEEWWNKLINFPHGTILAKKTLGDNVYYIRLNLKIPKVTKDGVYHVIRPEWILIVDGKVVSVTVEVQQLYYPLVDTSVFDEIGAIEHDENAVVVYDPVNKCVVKISVGGIEYVRKTNVGQESEEIRLEDEPEYDSSEEDQFEDAELEKEEAIDEDIDDDYNENSPTQEEVDIDIDSYKEEVELERKNLEEIDDLLSRDPDVTIDDTSLLDFDEETEDVLYDGDVLPEQQQESIQNENSLQQLSDDGLLNQEDLPEGSNENKKQTATNESIGDLISQTMFYQPDPGVDDLSGIDETVVLKVNGKEIKLPKQIKSGRELAQKLLQPGWLEKAKKYYVVSEPASALHVVEGKTVKETNQNKMDALTVVMVIEDEDGCYITALRSLGTTESDVEDRNDKRFVNKAEAILRAKLYIKNVNWSKILKPGERLPKQFTKRYKLYKEAFEKEAKARARGWYTLRHGEVDDSVFDNYYNNKPKKEKGFSKRNKEYKFAVDEWNEMHREARMGARLKFALPGKTVMTKSQIDEQINNLREHRNQVIKAYLSIKETKNGIKFIFPDKPRTDVVPAVVEQSNGKIQVLRDGIKAVFRSITDENSSIEDIQNDIESGKLILGFGKGAFAGEGERFTINGVFSKDRSTQFNGKGLSGKIYQMLVGPATKKILVPLMLVEEKFDYQEQKTKSGNKRSYLRNPENIKLCLHHDKRTGEISNVNQEGYLPSAAEVLVYMLMGKINLGATNPEQQASIIEFFIHCDESTLLKNQPKVGNDPRSFLAKKLLAITTETIRGKNLRVLNIATQDENGAYTVKQFAEDELFNEDEVSNEKLKTVIHAIATQMHWNTDLAHMNDYIDMSISSKTGMSFFIKQLINSQVDTSKSLKNQLNQTVSIAGCPLLSFKVGDFYQINESTGRIEPKRGVHVTAWMLKNKKLKTDSTKDVFYAPFVFASGVKDNTSKVEEEVKQQVANKKEKAVRKKKETETGSIDDFGLYDQQKLDIATNEINGISIWEIAQNDEQREKIRKALSEKHGAKLHNGIQDRIMFVPTDDLNKEELENYIHKKIKEFLPKYNKKYNLKYREDDILIGQNVIKKALNAFRNKEGVLVLDLYKDGYGKISVVSHIGDTKPQATGIFSTNRSKMKFDRRGVEEWLHKNLGIDVSNIIVTDFLIKSTKNERVYGAVTTALDSITLELTGIIYLDQRGGFGVAYHEAWHYVNLLMHTGEERQLIYDSYLLTHKRLRNKGLTNREIEEYLAEDFRNYMEGITDKTIKGRVKKLFNDIYDIIFFTRRKSLYRKYFEDIQSGKYGNPDISFDEPSIIDFKTTFGNFAYSIDYDVAGTSKDEREMPIITNHRQLFDTRDSIIRRVFTSFGIRTVKEVNDLCGKDFGDVVAEINDLIDEQDSDEEVEILLAVLKNENFIKKGIMNEFSRLGIKSKLKKIKSEETVTEGEPKDNTYDVFHLTVSKKDSAAFRAKLFMNFIPIYKSVDTSRGSEYVLDVDRFGVPKTYDFREVWTRLIDELWLVTSIDNRDEKGGFKRFSLYGMVSRRSHSDPLYYGVYERLKSLSTDKSSDIELRSQLFSTFNSSKPNISFIKLQDPRINGMSVDENFDFNYDGDDDFDSGVTIAKTADRLRSWILQNDNLYRATKQLPYRWSKNLASMGLMKTEDGKGVIDGNFVLKKIKQLNEIQNGLVKLFKRNGGEYVSAPSKNIRRDFVKYKKDFVSLLNSLGIDADIYTLDLYIKTHITGGDFSIDLQANALIKILKSTDKAKGTIRSILNELVNYTGKSEIPTGIGNNTKLLDEIYNSYGQQSEMARLALAWSGTYPSAKEFSVMGPNGEMYYPVGNNNEITDLVTTMNQSRRKFTEKARKDPYCTHSIVYDSVDEIDPNNADDFLKINAFVGIKDANSVNGSDYFEITAMEDYLAKMFLTENGHLICPTMADKKTWYSIFSKKLKSKFSNDIILHSAPKLEINKVIYDEYSKINPFDKKNGIVYSKWLKQALLWYNNDINEEYRNRILSTAIDNINERRNSGVSFDVDRKTLQILPRYSEKTLNVFCGYFIDELNAVSLYYSKKNIANLRKNKALLQDNFHGNFDKNGRMDFSGNGGKFRYFYNIFSEDLLKRILKSKMFDITMDVVDKQTGEITEGVQVTNLNQILQALYEIQKKIESGKVLKDTDNSDLFNKFVLKSQNNDGFELIRLFLDELKKECSDSFDGYNKNLADAINNSLIKKVYEQLEFLSKPGIFNLVKKDDSTGMYVPYAIPEGFFNKYLKYFNESGFITGEKAYDGGQMTSHVLFSLIANHVANTAMSVIEFEKIFAGDPAQYKYKSNPFDETQQVNVIVNLGKNMRSKLTTVSVENLQDVFSDKIKRLGGTLSPGENIRTDFTDVELMKFNLPKTSKYTCLNVNDLEVSSAVLDTLTKRFEEQIVIDIIRNKHPKWFDEFKDALSEQLGKSLTLEETINLIYRKRQNFENLLTYISGEEKSAIKETLELQVKPYLKINVSDAQVVIRPEMYRRIRIGLGLWSFDPDQDGYSDEEAYNIIEHPEKLGLKENQWLNDENLLDKVRKFQANVLKMSYFQNDLVEEEKGKLFRTRSIYNKMAIFPLFKFHRSTEFGRSLYERMNKGGNEIDMIAFKSAVKVGGVKNTIDPVEKTDNPKDALSNPSLKLLKLNNDLKIDYYGTGDIISNLDEETLPITIQDLTRLRMQMNTKAHESEVRNIGSQMFKLAFSNIIDGADYGIRRSGRQIRKGFQIKRDIMNCISALTLIGVKNIRNEFYNQNQVSAKKVTRKILSIIKSNDLGEIAREIITYGGVAAGLMSRSVFELSISKIVNSEVIDISTNGGTAFQQSIFGFVGHGNNNVRRGTLTEEELTTNKLLDTKLEDLNLSLRTLTQYRKADAYTLEDLINLGKDFGSNKTKAEARELLESVNLNWDAKKTNTDLYDNYITEYNNGKELLWNAEEGSMEVMLSINFFRSVLPSDLKTYDQKRSWLIENGFIGSNAKPYGIGYRIPTQGMLSMFVMKVADVLPEQTGDLIIVPREFTAQTGSDFDIDKLFLATMSYTNGVKDTISDSELQKILNDGKITVEGDNKIVRNAIVNRLLDNYIDVMGDEKTFSDARSSIDNITRKLHEDLIDYILKEKKEGYIDGLDMLTPSFQSLRKLKFGTGKDGIGAFALNVTNLALTQFTHLSFDYEGDGDPNTGYGFRHLDEIYGEDDIRISAWLSAMVNAHVDVATDPYIFDLNVNAATYNHTNFLIRAGKGISTFSFLALPILKELANEINNQGGLYGQNIEGGLLEGTISKKRMYVLRNETIRIYLAKLQNLLELLGDDTEGLNMRDIKVTIDYFTHLSNAKMKYDEDGNPIEEEDSSDIAKQKKPYGKKDMFDFKKGVESILGYLSDNVKRKINSIVYQLYVIEAFSYIDKYARSMSQLVMNSRIDTKKFGNEIPLQRNFYNKYNIFKYKSTGFIINKPGFYLNIEKNTGKKLTKSQRSKHALVQYFSQLYLDDKLSKATKYTKLILSRQLFTATDLFGLIFDNIASMKYGKTAYTKVDGVEVVTNKPILGLEKVVKSISQVIDNTIRFISLLSFGSEVYDREIKHNDQMIDFTAEQDSIQIRKKMQDLIYGNESQESLFARIRNLILDIRENPTSEKYRSLVNPNGEIVNELLLYLNPITSFDDDKIGRMMLNESRINVSDDKKVRILASFALLLQSNDKDIKRIAKDIAFYAYYSTYDLNTGYSFFDLVPTRARAQYDLSLKTCINKISSSIKNVRSRGIFKLGFPDKLYSRKEDIEDVTADVSNRIMDIISRNYYDNDNIVPTHYIYGSSPEELFDIEKGGDIQGPSIYSKSDNQRFPRWFISNRVVGDPIYVKLKIMGKTMLYKKVGYVDRYRDDKNNPMSIYMPVQKAGYRDKIIRQYELYCDFNVPSIFEQNRLDKLFSWDISKLEILEMLKNFKPEKYDLIYISFDRGSFKIMNKNTDDIYSTSEDDYLDNDIQVGIVKLNPISSKPNYVGEKQADVIINIVLSVTGEDDQISQIKEELRSKTITIGLNDDISKIVKKIKKIKTGDIRIHFTTPLFDNNFVASDSYVELAKQDQLSSYRNKLKKNRIGNIEDRIKEKEEEIIPYAKAIGRQRQLNDLVDQILLQTSLDSDMLISKITGAALKGRFVVSLAVSYANKQNADMLDSSGEIFVHRNNLASDPIRYRDFIRRLSKNMDSVANNDISEGEESANEQELEKYVVQKEIQTEKKIKEVVKKSSKQTKTENKVLKLKVKPEQNKFGSIKEVYDEDFIEEEQTSDDENPIIVQESAQKENNLDLALNKQCGETGEKKKGFKEVSNDDFIDY